MDYELRFYNDREHKFNFVVSVEVKPLPNFTLLRIKHKSGNVSIVSVPVGVMWDTQAPVKLI